MKLEQSFGIEAPLDRVWDALIDVERVAPLLPGAELGPSKGDGVYEGAFSVKLGPATAVYEGTLQMASLDADNHTTTMRASGRDKRGQGSVNATIVTHLLTEGESTRVDVLTDFTITGRLARFGRAGMIQDVANQLLEDFASALRARLAAETAPAETPPDAPREIHGFSLLLSVLRARLRRFFRVGRR